MEIPKPQPITPIRKTEQQWRDEIKGMLKAELKRQNLTYDDLANRLHDIGVEETEVSIRNKVSRGSFPAIFFFQCMAAIGVKMLPFREDYSFDVTMPPALRPKLDL